MRPAAFAIAVALVLPTLAPAEAPITQTDAVEAVERVVERIGAYSARHPDAPGGCSAWAEGDVRTGRPLLVHLYPSLEPAYYYVPLTSDRSGKATFVTLDARTGAMQAFGSRAGRGSFPSVTRGTAAAVASLALEMRLTADGVRAVGMPNRHIYWHAGAPGGREFFINVADASDVHAGLDERISPPDLEYRVLPDAHRHGAHNLDLPYDGGPATRYPDVYDIPNVPYHVQIGPDNCGPSAAEMVMDYWGPDINQHDIADVANCKPDSGSWNSDIRRTGHFSGISSAIQDPTLQGYDERQLGYGALDQWWSWGGGTDDPDYPDRYNDLKSLVSKDFPLLLLTRYVSGGNGHFRVVKGYNDSTSVFIVHDPWYADPYQGPDVSFDQAFLVDTLWEQIAWRWATLIAPWEVELGCPEFVERGEQFTVYASVEYTGPHPFQAQDTATGCKITIDPSPLFPLASGETATKDLLGFGFSGMGFSSVSWEVVADTALLGNIIEVTARGLISDSSHSYASYSDSIGGTAFQGVTIVNWVGVDEAPVAVRLHPATPSPFSSSTTLRLQVPAGAGRVALSIYDLGGRRVATLEDGKLEPGEREYAWDGTDDEGSPVASGIYFARCRCAAGATARKLVLLR